MPPRGDHPAEGLLRASLDLEQSVTAGDWLAASALFVRRGRWLDVMASEGVRPGMVLMEEVRAAERRLAGLLTGRAERWIVEVQAGRLDSDRRAA